VPLQIGQRIDHGFDEPLGLLSDCHRRIEHFLAVLDRVVSPAAGGPLTDQLRRDLEAALRYFAEAAPRHTADEEISVFPRLRQCDDPAASAAMRSIDALEHDHDEAEVHHARIDTLLRRWLADNALATAEVEEVRGRLVHLQALYRRHIAVEDNEVFPAAARVLDRSAIEAIGAEMAARRQTRPR